jgi:hypothetical protein
MPRKRKPKKTASQMLGRDSSRVEPRPAPEPAPPVELGPPPNRRVAATVALAAVAVACGVGAGIARDPKIGFGVALGVFVVGLVFGALLRPPPVRERPGDNAAIDFGRTDPTEPERKPNRAERRRKAREERRS